jgi:hypothetical protein
MKDRIAPPPAPRRFKDEPMPGTYADDMRLARQLDDEAREFRRQERRFEERNQW